MDSIRADLAQIDGNISVGTPEHTDDVRPREPFHARIRRIVMVDRSLVGVVALVAAIAVGCTGTSDPDNGVPESVVANDLTLAVGQSETRIVSTHCGYERLELEINGAFWATETLGADSAGNPTEPSWPQGTQSAELRLELIDPTTLSVRASGSDVSHEYHPIETEPWCE